MLRNNLIIAWRNFDASSPTHGHQPRGLWAWAWRSACSLGALPLKKWSFDRFHSKADRIYRAYIELRRVEGAGAHGRHD